MQSYKTRDSLPHPSPPRTSADGYYQRTQRYSCTPNSQSGGVPCSCPSITKRPILISAEVRCVVWKWSACIFSVGKFPVISIGRHRDLRDYELASLGESEADDYFGADNFWCLHYKPVWRDQRQNIKSQSHHECAESYDVSSFSHFEG